MWTFSLIFSSLFGHCTFIVHLKVVFACWCQYTRRVKTVESGFCMLMPVHSLRPQSGFCVLMPVHSLRPRVRFLRADASTLTELRLGVAVLRAGASTLTELRLLSRVFAHWCQYNHGVKILESDFCVLILVQSPSSDCWFNFRQLFYLHAESSSFKSLWWKGANTDITALLLARVIYL